MSLSDLDLRLQSVRSSQVADESCQLALLHLRANQFNDSPFLSEWSGLGLSGSSWKNQLTNLPAHRPGSPKPALGLSGTKFTSFTLPSGLTNLVTLSSQPESTDQPRAASGF
jgi:hypothetical protein